MAAADMLRREGHAVEIYDRYDRAGGLMMYGIPNFKLEKHVVQRRTELLKQRGVVFNHNIEIGRDISLQSLREKHQAVLIATGVYKAREIDVPEYHLPGVVPALDYLTTSNRNGLGDRVAAFDDGSLNAHGKKVVVIGGGDTAMDCVRTAIRQGAESVTCLYRRDKANMPGSQREVKNAEEEGVVFAWLSAPKAFIGTSKIEQIMVQRMHLGIMDSRGRQSVVENTGDTTTLPADMVIKALGYDADDLPSAFNEPSLQLSAQGTLAVNARFETSLSGVYAAGDIVRGASLVVWAIRDGRDAAAAIHSAFQSRLGKAA